MAAVTEDDNPGQLPVAGDEAPGAAAAGEVAGEAGGQDEVAQPGEPDAQAELDAQAGSADAAAPGAGEDEVLGAGEDEALGAGEDEAPGAGEDGEAPEEPARNVADLEQES